MNWYRAVKKSNGPVVVLAPGAGAGQHHPWLVARAQAWSAHGVDVVTFDFPYMEAGRRAPDRPAVLEDAWRRAIALAGGSVIAAGKSMGGRIATQVAAQGESGIVALVTLGYPLHPPGQPDKLRVAHLPRIKQPWLAIQGEKDTFGSPAELAPFLPNSARLHPIAGGDHSLSVPKKAGGPVDIDAIVVDWLASI